MPYCPYLTAMESAQDAAVMLHEIATIGVAMLAACVLLWAVMVVAASRLEAKSKARAGQTA